jgi:membrane fusion protein (multidrug efflux system)
MPQPFPRTLRALEADSGRQLVVAAAFLTALLAAWLAWLFLVPVAVHELTDQARLEVVAAAHPVSARLDGQVLAARLAIGVEVRAGDVLVELDAANEKLDLEEGRARAADLRARIAALAADREAEEEAGRARLKAGEISIAEAGARVKEAEARAGFTEAQAKTLEALEEGQGISALALRQARSEAQAERAAVDVLKLAVRRTEEDRAVEAADRKSRLAKLTREAVELEGLLAIAEASNRRLEREIDLRLIRAPVDGRVGEAADLRPGSVVRAGDRLGAVVPPGAPRAVAFFPVSGVGRIRPGQTARLRMDGFPWTRYGTLAATVTDLASEPRDGRVRVELALGENEGSEIPIEHGITGAAEIEVERTTPAKLVLRAAGEILSPPREGRGAATE